MHQTNLSSHKKLARLFIMSTGLVFTLLLVATGANGQASATDGTTPSGLAPGAPAGSYALSGFENVNLFNGNLNFSLPLLKIGGRGSAQIPITLKLDSVHWTAIHENGTPGSQPFPFSHTFPSPIIDSSSGTAPIFGVTPDWWTGLRAGFGPGVLQGRVARSMNRTTSLTRLTFSMPDGTEYELRDVANNGKPLSTSPRNRGTVFVSTDGSSVTFVSSTPIQDVYNDPDGSFIDVNGYLMMADGTRYDITTGLVRTITDRNGNRLTFTYDDTNTDYGKRRVLMITDSLGRQVLFTYDLEDSVSRYDRIKYSGFGGVDRFIKVRRTTLQAALRHTRSGDSQTTKWYSELFPVVYLDGFGDSSDSMYNPDDIVSAVEMPDGRSYQLYYNEYNELARVVLPTGGAIEYDYTAPANSVIVSYSYQLHRRVTERRTYDGDGVLQSKQLYLPTYIGTTSGGLTTWEAKIEVQQHDMVRDPAHTLINVEKHTFFGSPVPTMFKSGLAYSEWKEGREKQIETFDANNNLLRLVTNSWQQCTECEVSIDWWTNPAQSNHTTENAPSNNPQLVETETTLKDATPNLISKQTFVYDKFNNQTDSYDYDYNPTDPATYPVRHTKTDYVNSDDYTATSAHLRGLPTMQQVYSVNPTNGAETLAAKSETVYDESTYQLTTEYGTTVTGWTPPATNVPRGNATSSRAWYDVNSSNAYIQTHVQFDQLGNVRKTWDGRDKISEIDYSADYKYALPTHTKSPPVAATGSELETSSVYDFSSGLPTSTTDANGQTTYIEYNDVLSRPTKVTRPTGGGWASFEYGDSIGSLYVRTQSTLDASRTIEGFQYFDGLGRSTRSSQTEGATSILVDTHYDALGRVLEVSNPYRSGDTVQWTTTSYDDFGRVIKIKTPDNAEVLTAYSGNKVTVTDQAGKQRKSVTDALGRLTSVFEAPNDTSYNFQTSYLYDSLGNLKTVTQGAQTRTFVYDSLSRLSSATNPESGTINYSYDGNGNLLAKTDARGTTASCSYDGLNRVTQRRYDNGTAVATPTVTYSYDTSGVTNSKGRLTSVSSSISAYNYTGYDATGRVTASQQVTDGQTYSMAYSYDLAGNMTSQTYPTGRVVTQAIDNAGRLANISGQVSGATPKTYANSFRYTAHGAVERMRLGNGRWEHTKYDPKRLQPLEIGLGTSASDSSLLKLQYEYGTTANNGNVLKQVITVPTIGTATGFTATQNYQYDQLNRLTGAQEINGTSAAWQSSGTLWQQKFDYDQYGNRAVDTGNTTTTMIGPNPQINSANNRITPRSGEYYDYDYAGNMKKGQGGDTLAYDGENKLVQYQGGASQSGGADYSYDGDGRRVKKAQPSETLIFVYNISGQLVAEYTTSTPGQNGTSYLTSDALGSPRVMTRTDGSVKSRHDYLPYGEELFAGAGNRTGHPGQEYDVISNPADKTRQKFTSKERDIETGLDYFGARYFSSMQGRFTSADPLLASAEGSDPQTWNRYTYVTNNPLGFTDPTGERRNPVTGRRGINPVPANGTLGGVRSNRGNPHVGEWGMTRNGGVRPHFGTDITAPIGTNLVAMESGTVTFADNTAGDGGRQVHVRMADGTVYKYFHLSAIPEGIARDVAVQEGQVIAVSGNSGNAGGLTANNEDHVHVSIIGANGNINPVTWLNDPNAAVPVDVVTTTGTPPATPITVAAGTANEQTITGPNGTVTVRQQPLPNGQPHEHQAPVRPPPRRGPQ